MSAQANSEVFFEGERLDAAKAKIAQYPQRRSAILPLLHMVQQERGRVCAGPMREIAALLDLAPVDVLGTASFYGMFKVDPDTRGPGQNSSQNSGQGRGDSKHLVSVCGGIVCMLAGSHELYREILASYGCDGNEITDDGMFSFELVECAAACGGAPAIQVDYLFFERLQTGDAVDLLEDIRARGLDTVYAERGTVTAPLPPAAAETLGEWQR